MPFFRLLFTFALAIFGCFSVVQAQQVVPITQPLNTKTVLFDFESGNFDGWTLTGDCWDKAPATAKTFVDKGGRSLVSGVVGNGYITTFYKKSQTQHCCNQPQSSLTPLCFTPPAVSQCRDE